MDFWDTGKRRRQSKKINWALDDWTQQKHSPTSCCDRNARRVPKAIEQSRVLSFGGLVRNPSFSCSLRQVLLLHLRIFAVGETSLPHFELHIEHDFWVQQRTIQHPHLSTQQLFFELYQDSKVKVAVILEALAHSCQPWPHLLTNSAHLEIFYAQVGLVCGPATTFLKEPDL